MIAETSRVGKRGPIVIPAAIRRRLEIEEGAFVIVEEREDGVLIRPAAVMPIEMYTTERRAEFLLSNAVDAEDYVRAREEVKRMGLDPDAIPLYGGWGLRSGPALPGCQYPVFRRLSTRCWPPALVGEAWSS